MIPNDLKLQYENLGFLHLPKIIPQTLLQRLRTAFDDAATHYQPHWYREVAAGKANSRFCDIPHILDRDACFVELVSLPALLPILLMAVGDDIQLHHTQARLFPPGKTFTAPWHSDLAEIIGINLAHSPHFFVKVHFYLEDLTADQGCLAFLPGTHRLPQDYPRPAIENVDTSPAVVKVVPQAGDAVLFNTHLLHMALDNRSPLTRKSLIYAYSHFWLKNYPDAVPKNVEQYATTPLHRQMFGIGEDGTPYLEQRYTRTHNSSRQSKAWQSTRMLIQKIAKRV